MLPVGSIGTSLVPSFGPIGSLVVFTSFNPALTKFLSPAKSYNILGTFAGSVVFN